MSNLGVVYCIVVPILLFSFVMFINSFLFTLRAEKTTGIVVGYQSRHSNKGGVTHAEVVEFQGPDGKTVQFTEKAGRTRFSMDTGHTVNVLYNPNNPTNARINSFTTLYLFPFILLIIGGVVFIFNLTMVQDIWQSLWMTLQDFFQ